MYLNDSLSTFTSVELVVSAIYASDEYTIYAWLLSDRTRVIAINSFSEYLDIII